ncbi:MAG: hypothetical protein JWN48_3896 [Myxococcaceae bacterium]|nr:hypothetical protein [Myxococcaceae bacterium]
MTPPHDVPPSRLVFIDVLRLVAAVQMIQGHSVSAVLAPAYRHGLGYQCWTFARGLTSVSFLFSAGFAFALAEARGHLPLDRRRRAWRALRLILLGYLLHAPLGYLLHAPAPGAPLAAALRAWAAVDVLQCIGLSLLALELLTLSVRRARPRVVSGSTLALAALASAPALLPLSLSDLSLSFGNYLTPRYGSLFPLVPWAGYLFVGFVLGTASVRSPRHTAAWLLAAGALALPLGLLLSSTLPAWPAGVSPAYALVKLGCVLLLSALLAHSLRRVSRLPARASRLASQTLFLYASHTLLLYADDVGLAHWLGARHSPLFGVLLALVLLLACGAAALALGSLRGRSGSGTRAASSP